MEAGPQYIHEDQNDLQTQALRQQMDDVQSGWQQLQVLWDTRKALLEQSMNHQVESKIISNNNVSAGKKSKFSFLK